MKQILLYIFAICFCCISFSQEFGTDDFRISDCGGDGNANLDADLSVAAYNSTDDNYLVVWRADDTDFPGVVDNETEIIGQFIAADGTEIGSDFMISSHEGFGNGAYDAFTPKIAYNSTDNQFLITYSGETAADIWWEGYGVIISNTGAVVKPTFKITEYGPLNDVQYGSVISDVAYNATDNEYMVVFASGESVSFTETVRGQRLSALGIEIGADDFKISNNDDVNDPSYIAQFGAITWNSTANQYFVVWQAITDAFGDDTEIFGQILSNTGVEVGTDFQISANQSINKAKDSDVIYNATDNKYLVTWTDAFATDITEIYGKQIEANGASSGLEFTISNQQTSSSSTNFAPHVSSVIWQAATNSYFTVWRGASGFAYEDEIFMREMNTGGTFLSAPFMISNMGVDGDGARAGLPSIVSNGDQGLLINWYAQGNFNGLAVNENEIYIQMYGNHILSVDEFQTSEPKIGVYPNPMMDTLNFISNTDTFKYQLLNISGQVLLSGRIENDTNTLDVSHLSTGVYFINLQYDTKASQTIKLIKD